MQQDDDNQENLINFVTIREKESHCRKKIILLLHQNAFPVIGDTQRISVAKLAKGLDQI